MFGRVQIRIANGHKDVCSHISAPRIYRPLTPPDESMQLDAMHKITSEQFKQAVELDPAWASKLTEPVEITDYCDMKESKITHLSPLLHFTGRDESGHVADFWGCGDLKVAEGNYSGLVWFSSSGVEQIGDLVVTHPDEKGVAAGFLECEFLRVARGSYAGYVTFARSGIQRIERENLRISQANTSGWAADFTGCCFLRVAEGDFPGRVSFVNSLIDRIENLNVSLPDSEGNACSFEYCSKLKIAEGRFHGHVNFSETGIEKIGNLVITRPNDDGNAACFIFCERLKVAEGTFPGFVDFNHSTVEEFKDLIITQPNHEEQWIHIRGTPLGSDRVMVKKLFNLITQEKPMLEIAQTFKKLLAEEVELRRAFEVHVARKLLKTDPIEL